MFKHLPLIAAVAVGLFAIVFLFRVILIPGMTEPMKDPNCAGYQSQSQSALSGDVHLNSCNTTYVPTAEERNQR